MAKASGVMPIRVKSKWHRKQKPKSAEVLGGALAMTAWRVAIRLVQRLLEDDFEIQTNERRFAIMSEVLAFLIQSSDRFVYGSVSEQQRERLINALARRLAEILADNQTDMMGEGDYRVRFLDTLNERLSDYAELTFVDGEPGYSALRYLGDKVKAHCDDFDGKWMLEQMVEVEAPESVRFLKKSWNGLFDAGVE